ncbi:MAG: hypothetical protein L6R37_003871 [Teloschistes peruensis]|nr:MAG: hypothetical protein L6R37_003871 [Teloschistes peruensis]
MDSATHARAMFLSHDRHHVMPPPLSMDPPPPISRNGPSYPTQSPVSATVPSSLPESANGNTTPEPAPTSTIVDGRKYSLEISQEPIRARMCGFGDKDRRPITPPPCIRLVVRDASPPFDPIDINNIDTSFFVLTVDLWNEKGNAEVNLVRHSQTSPSISAATSASYPPPNMLHNPFNLPTQYLTGPAYSPVMPNSMMQQQGYPTSSMGYSNHTYQPSHSLYHGQQQIAPPTMYPPGYYATPQSNAMTHGAYYAMQQQGPLLSPQQLSNMGAVDLRGSTPTPSGMFTRNLIGSLGVSAFKLTDPENVLGIWFILQDLSVRTEGTFRVQCILCILCIPDHYEIIVVVIFEKVATERTSASACLAAMTPDSGTWYSMVFA